jgi:hypothetical protein
MSTPHTKHDWMLNDGELAARTLPDGGVLLVYPDPASVKGEWIWEYLTEGGASKASGKHMANRQRAMDSADKHADELS